MMDNATILRWQPGGDIFAKVAAKYGTSSAQVIAAAARTGDETQVNAALNHAMFGADANESTLSILASQSPSDWVNNAGDYWSTQANNVGWNLFKNLLTKPFVLLAVVVFVVLAWFYFTGKFKVKIPALPV